MSSQSDSQDISGAPSMEDEVLSDVESSSAQSSVGQDVVVALELQKALVAEAEAEGFEQECEDEELALAWQAAEEEAQRESVRVTVAVLPPRGAGEASTSRPLNAVPIRVAPGKKKAKAAAPKKKGSVADQGKPLDMPEGYSYLNTVALEIRSKADAADIYVTQLHVGPSAIVVTPGPDDVLSRAPEGCIAMHVLSVSMGLRFPLHPFLREYLRFVGLVPCQLTPNSHSYITGFLQLCKSRGVTPSLDLFFQSFNLCRGGHANAEGFANLQQVALFKLFTEAPSSNKGWKDRWCYVRLTESPFPRELRDRFRRHEKRRSAALEKDGRILAKIPEDRDKNITIKECTKEEDLYTLGFRRYRFLGETDEKFPAFEGASGGVKMDLNAFANLKKQKAKVSGQKEPAKQKPLGETKKGGEPSGEAAKRKAAGKAPVPEGKKQKKGAPGRRLPWCWWWTSILPRNPVLRLLLARPRAKVAR
ncbi:unnamed protein product [Cuscuta europaea]|uniref:Transposase (putative) gypsy type domain-containing protein n=1 Tax=Cuscuta europaea TaxID=41803 RepID=A0A9P1E538_CUSEU|nr:unnamed protein product [Cuscuta europaea]